MENIIDPEQFVGIEGSVEPTEYDPFTHPFHGRCIGVRKGFLQVRDSEDDVYEVEVSQFTPDVET